MNRYTPDNQFILDNGGNKYAVDVWHPLPMPNGINATNSLCELSIFNSGDGKFHTFQQYDASHWLIRRPLPPVPKPKTQDELDEESAQKWIDVNTNPNDEMQGWNVSLHTAFKAGLQHARKEAK